MKVQAIIPTAGIGKRLNTQKPKPFVLLQHKAILAYALQPFQQSALIDSIIVVAHPDSILKVKNLLKKHRLTKVAAVVAGGRTRSQSVYNGLEVSDTDTDFVVIHDGARPLLTKKLLEGALRAAQKCLGLVVAVPVKQTIKRISLKTMHVQETLNRDCLWEIQTPQIFRRNILSKAYQKLNNDCPTDDAALVERLGVKVKIFKGDYRNIKITTREDLAIAKAFLGSICS